MLNRAGPVIGLNTSDIVEVEPATGVTMWFIPGETGQCIVVQATGADSGGASCGLIASGKIGPAVVSGSTVNGVSTQTVFGFAANGNSTIAAQTSGGATLNSSVSENAYVIHPADGTYITSLTGKDLAGDTTHTAIGAN
jgi:hypothetical protein